jgi:hypothetical protein
LWLVLSCLRSGDQRWKRVEQACQSFLNMHADACAKIKPDVEVNADGSSA